MTRSQFGYTYSSQMFCNVTRVLSFSHCAFASLAALRFSGVPIRADRKILQESCLSTYRFLETGPSFADTASGVFSPPSGP